MVMLQVYQKCITSVTLHLNRFTAEERIEMLALRFCRKVTVAIQTAYEEPNPITWVSQADLDCALGLLPRN